MKTVPRGGTRWLALVIALMMVLTACSSADDAPTDDDAPADATTTTAAPDDGGGETEEPDDEPTEGETGGETSLNVYLYQEPRAWNPLLPFHGPDQQLMDLFFQKLVINNADFEFEGRLAESWEISEDARTFTFTLYDGLQWTDGTPLTAADVKFSFDLLANPNVAGAAGRFTNVVGQAEYAEGTADDVSGYRAPDDRTFVIELIEPNVGFLTTVVAQSMYVMPQHILGDVPPEELEDHGFFLEPTVGYGPYTFTEYNVDQDLVVEANPDYHLGAPQIDRLVFRQLTSDVATAQLGTGELDLAFISATDVETVEGFDGITLAPAPGAGFLRMAINHTQERFQDKRVRQAMLHAIDRQGLVDVILEGFGDVINVGYHSSWALPGGLNEYPYDPDRARELLAEAGWDSSQPVEIQWIEGTRDRDAAVPIIQQQWEEVGIQTELATVEVAELLDKANNYTFDLTLFGGGDYSVDPHPLYLRYNCEALWMGPTWCDDPEVQAMVELWQDADATADPDERQAEYHEIAAMVNDLVPVIFLFNNDTIWAHSDRLAGFGPHGNFTEGFWNAHEWRIEE